MCGCFAVSVHSNAIVFTIIECAFASKRISQEMPILGKCMQTRTHKSTHTHGLFRMHIPHHRPDAQNMKYRKYKETRLHVLLKHACVFKIKMFDDLHTATFINTALSSSAPRPI